VPEEPTVGLSISGANEKRLADLLLKFKGQFGKQTPSAGTRPTATTSCIQTDALAPIPTYFRSFLPQYVDITAPMYFSLVKLAVK
jgi:hypothetical protein